MASVRITVFCYDLHLCVDFKNLFCSVHTTIIMSALSSCYTLTWIGCLYSYKSHILKIFDCKGIQGNLLDIIWRYTVEYFLISNTFCATYSRYHGLSVEFICQCSFAYQSLHKLNNTC